jgi:cation diffusion facilitator family transporter
MSHLEMHASKRVIYAALFGNLLIAVMKFGAAFTTGSSAMLSEAVHSLVDTGNQGLLLYGLRRAQRPPDDAHPYGYGMELYFWTFVVAILIFGLGAGVSIYEGVQKLLHPHPITNPAVSYAVLSFALLFEAAAWTVAFREFRKVKGAGGYLDAVRRSKDPTLFTVLFEDSAAMAGLVFAFVGILAGQLLDMPEMDGIAAICIGIILTIVAALLAYEAKGLLIGESATPSVVKGIRRIVKEESGILTLNELLTMHFGPRDVLLNLSLDFADALTSREVEESISRMEQNIKMAYPEVTRVFIEAQGARASKRAG